MHRASRNLDAAVKGVCGPQRSCLLFALFDFALYAVGCGPTSFLITPVPTERALVEHVVQRDSFWAHRKIALIDVDGVITSGRPPSLLGGEEQNPIAVFREKLDQAAKDKAVKALVLRIDSPGGGVTASDLMYTELKRFKAKTGKPIVAVLLDLAASGGYYIACAADRIYALPTTVTGSIGVIMIAPEISGTMQKIGLKTNVIKSGEMKDAGSPFREMTEQDRAVFTGMIRSMYERFVEVVAAARPGIEPEQLRKLADGRVYLAPQARELGLIDEVGSLHDAIAAAKQAAGLEGKDILVVEYALPSAHRPNVYAQTAGQPWQVNLINVELPAWLRDPAPQFLYLWAPGW